MQAVGQAQWLRLGLRRRIVKAFYPPDRIAPEAFTTDFHESRYSGDLANVQEWHVYFFGGYELKEVALLRDLLRRIRAPVAFDIGANLGGHALAMAPLADRLFCFEPYGPLADKIEARMAENGLTHVTVNRFGLADAGGVSSYFLDTASRNSGTGSFLPWHTGAEEAARLPLRRGDDWAHAATDAAILPDLIKIDIEGYEAPALKGLTETLRRAEPLILMEVTETSARMFDTMGGLAAVIPFAFDLYEVCNPATTFGMFTRRMYRLEPRSGIKARRNSFNLLIVPHGRRAVVAALG